MQNLQTYTRVFGDLTKTRFGMERNVVRLLRSVCEDYGIDGPAVTVVTDERQRELVVKELPAANVMVSQPGAARVLLLSLVKGLKEEGPFLVVSYDRDVLELERDDARLRALSFGRYRFERAKRSVSASNLNAVAPTIEAVLPTAPAPAVPTEAETASPAPPVLAEPQHRSKVFGKILVDRKLGPFADHRRLAYDAVQSLVEGGERLCVSELLDRAVRLAQDRSIEREQRRGSDKNMNPQQWRAFRKFIEQVMLDARVLLSAEGSPLGRDWRSRSQPVAALADKWRAAIDAQLILGLIDEREDISSLDARNLARALYHSPSEESETRVNQAVVYLIDAGTVEDKDGVLRRAASVETRIRAVS